MCRNSRFHFEDVQEAMTHVSVSDFRRAIAAFNGSKAFVAVGLP